MATVPGGRYTGNPCFQQQIYIMLRENAYNKVQCLWGPLKYTNKRTHKVPVRGWEGVLITYTRTVQ